jgi:hypothetical protein
MNRNLSVGLWVAAWIASGGMANAQNLITNGTVPSTTHVSPAPLRFPRASWFGVWNSFTSGTRIYQNLAIVDNANATGLMQHPRSLTRSEIPWAGPVSTPPIVDPVPPQNSDAEPSPQASPGSGQAGTRSQFGPSQVTLVLKSRQRYRSHLYG